MSRNSGHLITLHFGKRVLWDYSPELSHLFRGFITRFRDDGPPDLFLSVGIREQEGFFETDGNSCFFREAPAELDFISLLSYWTRNLLARHARDALVLHASALRTRRGALLMVGPGGSGKTTLVKALCSEGYGFLAEDGAPVNLCDETVSPAMPMSFLPDEISGPTRLFRVISLTYAPGLRISLTELMGREAALVLLRENFNLRATGSRGLEFIAKLSERGIVSLVYPSKEEATEAIRKIAEK
ncbi:MAG: hypothetical protein ABIM46_01460 [candidate division WOR-3 bacterium]